MKNKPASLLVVPLGKACSRIPPSLCGKQMLGYFFSKFNFDQFSKISVISFTFFFGRV